MAGPTDPATVQLLTDLYRKHYATFTAAPEDSGSYEWMMAYSSGRVVRPIFFPTPDDVVQAVRNRCPTGAYHSVNSSKPMEDGKRKDTGLAMLPVDVDCKPGPRPTPANPKASGNGYPNLNAAISAAGRQVAQCGQVLESDFGLTRHEIPLNFSGSKGYHIRISKGAWEALDKPARLELGRHLTAHNVQIAKLWPGKDGAQMPAAPPRGGLSARVFTAFKMTALKIRSRDPQLLADLHELNQTRLPDEEIIAAFADPQKLLRNEELRDFAMVLLRETYFPRVDTGVIQNRKGMIRMLGSINGKTGLLCCPVDWNKLADFDPFIHANPHKGDDIRIVGLAKRAITAGTTKFEVQPDVKQTLPLPIAAVFMSAGFARVA